MISYRQKLCAEADYPRVAHRQSGRDSLAESQLTPTSPQVEKRTHKLVVRESLTEVQCRLRGFEPDSVGVF